jgi:hypothetical protein
MSGTLNARSTGLAAVQDFVVWEPIGVFLLAGTMISARSEKFTVAG